jgi:PhnB protein
LESESAVRVWRADVAADDADALWASALDAGAKPRGELSDAFWGERHAQVIDPFGHRWNIAQRLRDVPHDEIVAAAAQAFGTGRTSDSAR